MENAITSTASSLDEVLEKLNKDEKEKKIGRKEMENIFDNIVNNGGGKCEDIFIVIISFNHKHANKFFTILFSVQKQPYFNWNGRRH